VNANRGKAVTSHWLGRTLRRFGIQSVKVAPVGGKQRRGYGRDQFLDTWTRYLDTPSIQPSEVSQPSQASCDMTAEDASDGLDACGERNSGGSS
jgi:hypothetical protein